MYVHIRHFLEHFKNISCHSDIQISVALERQGIFRFTALLLFKYFLLASRISVEIRKSTK